jgi:hypothetical protein
MVTLYKLGHTVISLTKQLSLHSAGHKLRNNQHETSKMNKEAPSCPSCSMRPEAAGEIISKQLAAGRGDWPPAASDRFVLQGDQVVLLV